MVKKEEIIVWRSIFSNWKYISLSLLVALIFYELNVLLSSWNSLYSFFISQGFSQSIILLFNLSVGFKSTIAFHSFVSLIIISLMLGILTSILSYKVSLNISGNSGKFGILGGFGIFLAAFAPGCVACGIGFASFLGIGTAFLTFLPYEGLELSILSILIISYSIHKTTLNMLNCKVKFNSVKGGKI